VSVYLEQIFSRILEMSIIAGYCVLAVLVLRWLFRKAPKKYTYLLWLVVAFRLVCPLTVDSAFSIFNLNLLPESVKTESEVGSDRVELPETNVPGVLPDNGGNPGEQPGIEPEIGGNVGEQPEVKPEIGGAENQESGKIPENPGSLGQAPQTSLLHEIDWMKIGAWVWMAGMVCLTAVMLTSWIRLKIRVRTAVKVKTRVYETDEIDSAFVMGIRKPTIYLPMGLNPQEQAWILLHETCHIWRKDYLVKMFATVLTIVYWFHPLVWVGWLGMCRDMEMSCDEMALEGAGAELRKAYSRTLLTVATNKKLNWNVITAFGEVSVKSRIKHVLSFKKPAVWMGAAFVVVLVAALVVFGTNGRAEDKKVTDGSEVVENETSSGMEESTGESEETTVGTSDQITVVTKIPSQKEPINQMYGLTNALWLEMLSQIDSSSKSCCPKNAGRDENVRHQFNESYTVEMVLEAFKYMDFYSASALYNGETVADFGWGWADYAWTDGLISHENVDEDYFQRYHNYSGKPYSGLYQEEYLKAKENSVLQISGSIETESYEAAEAFIRDTAPYYYYEMWGTVLREVGDLWQRFNEINTWIGRMAGDVYMISFDVENLRGIYWICLEGKSPVELTVKFKNQDGGKQWAMFKVLKEWPESIQDEALMKMSFDLRTTSRGIGGVENTDEWKSYICDAMKNYDETHPWYADYGVFFNSETDFDGDGIIDRKFLATNPDNAYGIEYLILSTGHIIEVGNYWPGEKYEAQPLDIEGDGVNEIAIFKYVASTGGDVTCIQLMKKTGEAWTEMPFVYSSGKVMEEIDQIKIPTVRQKTDDTHMLVTQPECGVTVEMNVFVGEFDHWGFGKGEMGPITVDIYSGTIKISTDPETGKAILTVTGNVGDKWVTYPVVWEMIYENEVWKIMNFASVESQH